MYLPFPRCKKNAKRSDTCDVVTANAILKHAMPLINVRHQRCLQLLTLFFLANATLSAPNLCNIITVQFCSLHWTCRLKYYYIYEKCYVASLRLFRQKSAPPPAGEHWAANDFSPQRRFIMFDTSGVFAAWSSRSINFPTIGYVSAFWKHAAKPSWMVLSEIQCECSGGRIYEFSQLSG